MNDAHDVEDEVTGAKKKTGTGKTERAGDTGGIRIPPHQSKQIQSKYLDASEAASRVAEFFSEGVATLSAQAVVVWGKTFTVLTDFIKWGENVSRYMMNLTRENIQILEERYNLILSGPSG